jgi:hypothetical protein
MSVCANKYDGLSKVCERLGVAQSVAAFPNYCQPVQVYEDTHNARISQANIYVVWYYYLMHQLNALYSDMLLHDIAICREYSQS